MDPRGLTNAGTATAFPLQLRLHYKAARAAGVTSKEAPQLIIRAFTLMFIFIVGVTIFDWFRLYWWSAPVALFSMMCAIIVLIPAKYQLKSFWLVRGFGLAALAFGVYLLVMRISFISANGGMEGPDGYGSPLAFLIGLAYEQTVFTLFGGFIGMAYTRRRVLRWQNA